MSIIKLKTEMDPKEEEAKRQNAMLNLPSVTKTGRNMNRSRQISFTDSRGSLPVEGAMSHPPNIGGDLEIVPEQESGLVNPQSAALPVINQDLDPESGAK